MDDMDFDLLIRTLRPVTLLIDKLERREVITTDPAERDTCCGLPRDEDGFCSHRPSHPIFVNLNPRDH